MHQPAYVLEVEGLTKNYGAYRAVDGVSFRLARGQVLGLLGPNGAGKTTTIHMLVGVTLPDGGSIRYFGRELASHRQECLQRVNFASSFNTLQGRISVWENLLVFAHLYSLPKPKDKIRELASYFGIEPILPQRFVTLSAGQKTRVNLVKALLNDPEVVLMDEPTASLDPDIADRTMALIEEMKATHQLSIVYTSHEMDEVARICDQVLFLDRGRIVAYDTPAELTRRLALAELRLRFEGSPAVVMRTLKGRCTFPAEGLVVLETEERLVPEAIVALHQAGITVTDVDVKKPTLEDFFLQIARGSQRVA